MADRLDELAEKLNKCRQKSNKMTLDMVLESARILAEAKELAGRGFGKWLKESGRMDYDTARRHMQVAKLVRENTALTREFASLSIAKIYALTTLDFDIAERILKGKEKFSKPLEEMSDVQFRKEFREKFPVEKKHRTRQHVYQQVLSALVRVEKALQQGSRFASKMTPAQHRRLAEKLKALNRAASAWKIVV